MASRGWRRCSCSASRAVTAPSSACPSTRPPSCCAAMVWPEAGAMGEELLINITPMETRVARVENGMLQEVHIERSRARGIVGNIYLGRVVRVLPGMQAAFVEVGLERTGFLHASDIERLDHRGLARPTDGDSRHNGEPADIRELLREGQSLVVQVTKDPIGSKGARLTTRLSISSRLPGLPPPSPPHRHLPADR